MVTSSMTTESESAADQPADERTHVGWPAELTWIRHGESVGNVAALHAREAGKARLDLEFRDADTPLSDVGERQAAAVGSWWRDLPEDERPDVVLSSPYQRALDTARTAVERAGWGLEVRSDERLRERDLGAFDGLTSSGISELYESEAERRQRTGKLYYRPPGGESWCDVALRVRSLFTSWQQELTGKRVAVFSHQAVIMCARMVIEHLGEERLLEIDRGEPLGNCSLTTYVTRNGSLQLVRANDTTAVDRQREPVTKEPGAQVAADVQP
ncbi:MAG TPA: histidine phosphatase family protein [Actinomycetales bacterium]|nr:histidine phosphatase family protein [Actinomycetales bacterium]